MLKLEQISFPDNLLVIEEEPVFVDTKLSKTISKTNGQIEQDRANRRYRTGIVIAMGRQFTDINSTIYSSPTGKEKQIKIGTTVFYAANSVDVNDCPIEHPKMERQLIYCNRNFLQGIIDIDEQSIN